MMWFWRAVFLLLLLLLGGFGWQLYAQQQLELARLDHNQATLTQQLADLNDRLVAVARVQASPHSSSNPPVLPSAEQTELLRQNIRQSLTLAQHMIRIGQAAEADALLLGVQAVLQNQAPQGLAPAVLQGLQRTIQADRASISQSVQQQQTSRQAMDHALMRIQQQLDQMARQGPVLHLPDHPQPVDPAAASHSETVERGWLDRLAQLVSIQRVSSEQPISVDQRALICREVALTMGLARYALRQQQPDQVRLLLREAEQQLSGLPDGAAVDIRQLLERLAAAPLPQVPVLKSLGLLPERVPS